MKAYLENDSNLFLIKRNSLWIIWNIDHPGYLMIDYYYFDQNGDMFKEEYDPYEKIWLLREKGKGNYHGISKATIEKIENSKVPVNPKQYLTHPSEEVRELIKELIK